MLLKLCNQYARKFGNFPAATGLKRPLFIPIPKKSIGQESSNYHTIALISHASQIMLKILQNKLQKYMNQALPDVKAGFMISRVTRDQIANICWITEEKHGNSRKTLTSASLTTLKFLTVWIITNWKILKVMGIPGHFTCLLRNMYAGQEATVRTEHRKMTGSKLGKEYVKTVYCHPAYLTYMQYTSCEKLG